MRYATTESVQAPTYPNTTSVQHKTTDNKFVITESFAQSTATKTVTVTMKVLNKSGSAQFLTLARTVDFDAGGDSADNSWVQTGRTVQATRPANTTAILAGATAGLPMATMTIPSTSDEQTVLDTQCYDALADANIGPTSGDRMASVQYDFGLVNNNVTKTVMFTYQAIF